MEPFVSVKVEKIKTVIKSRLITVSFQNFYEESLKTCKKAYKKLKAFSLLRVVRNENKILGAIVFKAHSQA